MRPRRLRTPTAQGHGASGPRQRRAVTPQDRDPPRTRSDAGPATASASRRRPAGVARTPRRAVSRRARAGAIFRFSNEKRDRGVKMCKEAWNATWPRSGEEWWHDWSSFPLDEDFDIGDYEPDDDTGERSISGGL